MAQDISQIWPLYMHVSGRFVVWIYRSHCFFHAEITQGNRKKGNKNWQKYAAKTICVSYPQITVNFDYKDAAYSKCMNILFWVVAVIWKYFNKFSCLSLTFKIFSN